jgi:hypothetical protein
MPDKEIALLNSRIERLHAPNFDLEAWKDGTIVLLDRLFGAGNAKSKHIEQIRYEFNSWELRDATGSSDLRESCKRRGEEILNVAIEEISLYGAAVQQSKADTVKTVLMAALEQELKIGQIKSLTQAMRDAQGLQEKSARIDDILDACKKAELKSILKSALMHPAVTAAFKDVD